LDLLEHRKKLDEEQRRLQEAQLQPIQLQVQLMEERRQLEQLQIRKMELEYQLHQSEQQQEQIRLQRVQLQQQLEEQQRERLQTQQDYLQWEQQQQQMQLLNQQAAWQRDQQQLAEQQLQLLQQQSDHLQQLQSADRNALQRNDDAALLSILGDAAAGRKKAAQSGTLLRRPRSAAGVPRRAVPNQRLVKVEVHRKADLWRISRALSAADLVLQKDLEVEGVTLAKGFRLLRQGALNSGGSAKAALEALEPWVRLTFERPFSRHLLKLSGQEGFNSYAWLCPGCNSPLPVQAPTSVTACALLARLLPGVEKEGTFPHGHLRLFTSTMSDVLHALQCVGRLLPGVEK